MKTLKLFSITATRNTNGKLIRTTVLPTGIICKEYANGNITTNIK
jgi:hypothetical protein